MRLCLLFIAFALTPSLCAAPDPKAQGEKKDAAADEKTEKKIEKAGSQHEKAPKENEKDPAAKSRRKVPTKPAKTPPRVLAAWIVVSHSKAPRALPGVSRSMADAKKRASEALAEARKPGVDFAAAATEFSDDPRASQTGGKLQVFSRSHLSGAFQAMGDALFNMEIGQVSDVVESPFGFVILTRLPIVEYSARHILIGFEGAANSQATRTKKEAKKLAEELTVECRKPGADFAKLAMEHSEGPSASKGGSLGVFGPGRMLPAFETAVAKIEVGEVTGPVETKFGFHVIRREKVELAGARHILIQYNGAQNATTERTKEAAKKLATELAAKAKAAGADFAELAKKHSEGPTGQRGGELGVFGRGQMLPAFEKAVFGMKVGDVAGPVETAYGFHVIQRTQ